MHSSINMVTSARMERGTILICIFSIFIFVQDVPYYNHAAGSQVSMITGKNLALINLRGVVSSQRLRGVVIDTTLLATGSSYGKTPCPHHEGGSHLVVSERRLPHTVTIAIGIKSNGQLVSNRVVLLTRTKQIKSNGQLVSNRVVLLTRTKPY